MKRLNMQFLFAAIVLVLAAWTILGQQSIASNACCGQGLPCCESVSACCN
jgi:hypothetical protein